MAPSHRNGGDRLSALPDKALQRVLSHLMSDEAVRTSGLSRRWRHVHEGVPVVHLVDTKAGERYGRCGSGLKVCFDHQVTSAIMGKGIGTPIRAFRVSADPRPRPVRPARPVDCDRRQLRRRGPRRRAQVLRRLHGHALPLPPLPHPRNEALGGLRQRRHQQVHEYALPHLRLPHAPPAAPHQLDARSAGGRAHGGAGDALPRKDHGPSRGAAAAHLRLPGPRQTDAGGVPHHQGDGRDARPPAELRHDLLPPRHRRPAADHLPRVAALQGRPSSPWLVLHHRRKLIRRCAKRAYLHLSLRPSMACNLFTGVLRGLDSLTHLSLQGCLPTDDAVLSVSTLLTEAKNLEVLSLFPLGPEPPKNKRKRMHRGNDDDESDSDSEPEDGPVEDGVKYSSRLPKRLRQTYARCLAHKVRRINIANFEGRPLEKMLARFLLSRAVALEEFSVTLAAGVHPRKAEITKELISWRQNRRARVTCNLD